MKRKGTRVCADQRISSNAMKMRKKGKIIHRTLVVETQTQNQSPSSVETVLSNEDLLMEILLRLPAEFLLGCKLVSKFWYSVISIPEFSLRHSRKPAAATGILFLTQDFVSSGAFDFVPLSIENPASPPFTKLPLTDDASLRIRIQQSCNGLLLCSSFKQQLGFLLGFGIPDGVHPDIVFQYFVCNATTKRFVTLPDPGLEAQELSSSSWIQGMSLAFDPAKSPHYKVVCVRCFTDKKESYGQFQIEVYSSETRSWRKSGDIFTAKSDFGKHGVFWNGAVHWLYNACKDLHYYKVDDGETLHMMRPMPRLRTHRRLVESCDHLHLIDAEEPFMGVYFRFYEMKMDRSEWVFKYHIKLYSPIEDFRKLTLLVLVRNREDDDASLVVGTIKKMVARYHLVKNAASAVSCESYLYRKGKNSRYHLVKKAASKVACESFFCRNREKFRYHPANRVCSHVSQFFEFTESLCPV